MEYQEADLPTDPPDTDQVLEMDLKWSQDLGEASIQSKVADKLAPWIRGRMRPGPGSACIGAQASAMGDGFVIVGFQPDKLVMLDVANGGEVLAAARRDPVVGFTDYAGVEIVGKERKYLIVTENDDKSALTRGFDISAKDFKPMFQFVAAEDGWRSHRVPYRGSEDNVYTRLASIRDDARRKEQVLTFECQTKATTAKHVRLRDGDYPNFLNLDDGLDEVVGWQGSKIARILGSGQEDLVLTQEQGMRVRLIHGWSVTVVDEAVVVETKSEEGEKEEVWLMITKGDMSYLAKHVYRDLI